MPITTKVVSSISVHGEVYSIQHYVRKVCQWIVTIRWFSPSSQWLVTIRWFSLSSPVYSINKTDCHDVTEILLKVALNTINQPNQPIFSKNDFDVDLLVPFRYLISNDLLCLVCSKIYFGPRAGQGRAM